MHHVFPTWVKFGKTAQINWMTLDNGVYRPTNTHLLLTRINICMQATKSDPIVLSNKKDNGLHRK